MDIGFIVHDVFALTRPQWKLASNLEEAGRAFQLAMTQDQKSAGLERAPEPEELESDGSSDDATGEAEADSIAPDAEAVDGIESEEEFDVSISETN